MVILYMMYVCGLDWSRAYSLFGGKVQAVREIPQDEDGPHVAEHHAVEAERHDQGQEHEVEALPELERNLHRPRTRQAFRRSGGRRGDDERGCVLKLSWTHGTVRLHQLFLRVSPW